MFELYRREGVGSAKVVLSYSIYIGAGAASGEALWGLVHRGRKRGYQCIIALRLVPHWSDPVLVDWQTCKVAVGLIGTL